MMEFVVPMHPEDLEIEAATGRQQYCVRSTGIDMESEASISTALATCVSALPHCNIGLSLWMRRQ